MAASLLRSLCLRGAVGVTAMLLVAAAAAAGRGGGDAEPLTMEALRQRLAERVAQAQAGQTRGGVPVVNVTVKGGAARPRAAARAAPAAGASPAAGQATGHPGGHPAGEPPGHWGYDGPHGPQAWGGLDAAYASCATGTRQSPIDLREGFRLDLPPIDFQYRPGAFAVTDTGHTLQVEVAEGGAIAVGARRYALQQVHFHHPAEERIDGRGFALSMHLEHRDAAGALAVVAVLVQAGAPHAAVQQVWNALPLEQRVANAGVGLLDAAQLLPEDRRYFTYLGSLTTPPCTEGVLWLVLKQPVTLSPEQIALFARLYPMNARPLQAAHGRRVNESK